MDDDLRKLEREALASPGDFQLRVRLSVARQRAGIVDHALPICALVSSERASATTSTAWVLLTDMMLSAPEDGTYFVILSASASASPVDHVGRRVGSIDYGFPRVHLALRRGGIDMTESYVDTQVSNAVSQIVCSAQVSLKKGEIVSGAWRVSHGTGITHHRQLSLVRLADAVVG